MMIRKVVFIFLGWLTVVAVAMAIVRLPITYSLTFIAGVAILISIVTKVIKPIWVVALVYMIAPFIDVLRASFLKDMPFIGIYQELILLFLLLNKLILARNTAKSWHFKILDLFVILYVFWNLFEVFQSPSILEGLYVWRWYSIGPLTYLIFRLYEFQKDELKVVIFSICIGLAAASAYVFYQYFILGPETAAQISQSLGFTALYRMGWRLPGPFGSPLVASASYSILVLFGMALLSTRRFNWLSLCLIGIGGLAIFFTLSRSGIAISLVGLISIALFNLGRIKYKVIPVVLVMLLVLQFSYLIPEHNKFLSYITSTSLDSYDADRLAEFDHILTEAATKYPFGIGFAGGGAVSLQAFELFGGDRTYLPEYLGGDSVFLATLQTSGFMGFLLIISIYVVLVYNSIKLLARNLTTPQKIFCLASLGFFLGTLVSLGNLIDVWPLKLYLWSFGAIVTNFAKGFHNPLRESGINV